MKIDELIENAEEKARVHEYHADFFENGNPMRDACLKSSKDCKQLAEWLMQLKEYQSLEEQERLIILPLADDKVEHRECVHTKATCHHEECKCSECPLTELFLVLRRGLCNRCLAGIELGESKAETKLKELRCNND